MDRYLILFVFFTICNAGDVLTERSSGTIEGSLIDTTSFLQIFVDTSHVRGVDDKAIVTRWVGCYKDDEEHDLEWNPEGQFTITGCMQECLYTRYAYMAMQAGTQCWCGNGYERNSQYYQIEDDECDQPCIADDSQSDSNSSDGESQNYCGGHLANAVFKLEVQLPKELLPSTETQTTLTQSSVTMTTYTATTATTTTLVPYDGLSLQTDEVCADKAITTFIIGGKPQPCSNLSHYCQAENYTEKMQSVCPVTCGLCQPVWIGCFHDDSIEHDLEVQPPGKHTTKSCMEACAGFMYMGLQNGSTCWCGMHYGTDTKRYYQMLDEDCGNVCPGENHLSPTRYCGKPTVNAVYKLPAIAPTMVTSDEKPETDDVRLSSWPPGPTPNISDWIGCFHDEESQGFAMQAVGKHITETCKRECTNFTYMALENEGTCWCANSYDVDAHPKIPEFGCGDVCHGEAGLRPVRYCGGKLAKAVYKLEKGPIVIKGKHKTTQNSAAIGETPTKITSQIYAPDSIPQPHPLLPSKAAQPAPSEAQTVLPSGTQNSSTSEAYTRKVATFLQFDSNHDGAVSMQELGDILLLTNPDLWNMEKIEKLVIKYDTNNNGQLQLSEFIVFLSSNDDMKNQIN